MATLATPVRYVAILLLLIMRGCAQRTTLARTEDLWFLALDHSNTYISALGVCQQSNIATDTWTTIDIATSPCSQLSGVRNNNHG